MTTPSHQITAVHVRDYKRVREILIRPEEGAAIILIGGDNANGKTSLLDAMSAALGGAHLVAADPVRHGAEIADIRIELDGGDIQIHRTVTKEGVHQLEVREEGVKARSPQKLLDAIRGTRFLDPLAFLALPASDTSSTPARPKCQRSTLLSLVAEADRLAELEKKRVRGFDKRTEHNRDLKKAQGELARQPVVNAPAPIDVAEVMAKMAAIGEAERDRDRVVLAAGAARGLVTTLSAQLDTAKHEVARLEAALHAAEVDVDGFVDKLAAMPAVDRAAERAALESKARIAQEHNAAAAQAAATNARRAQLQKEIEVLEAGVAGCTDGLELIEKTKAEILAKAKLPVPGLGVDENGVTLHGVPLAQASGAERHRVALGIAIAASPNLRDVWIRDGALLDEHSLKAVADQAAAAGVRVWIERVGSADPGALIIRDGGLAGG